MLINVKGFTAVNLISLTKKKLVLKIIFVKATEIF